jgi:CheY-like chemotaxis protein
MMETSSNQRKTVLLVEDSKLQRMASERTLSRAGYAVLNAATGEEALRLAHEGNPDVIVLDMLLPGMGGEHVLRNLKGDAVTTKIPVVVLSSLSQANSAKLREDGAADYFEKSRMFEDANGEKAFLDMIREVLREAQVKN